MFSFVNGLLALGTLGGAIPIIIHLLNRRRFRITRWAAMEFLLASLRKNYKRIRMENLLLLLLRVLMVVLIALALARPRLTESGILGALGTESRHAILLLDDSFSMGYGEGSATCFGRAKAMARQILGSLNKGDVISLLTLSDVTRPIIKEATPDIGLVKREIKRAEPGWGGTDIREALITAAGLLDSTKRPRKEIFIITDMQALGWGEKGQKPSPELKAALERIRKGAKAFVVDAGFDGAENVAITKLTPLSKIVGTGSASEFKVEVSNFGRTTKSGIQLRCFVDKFNQDNQTVDIPPGKTETVSFNHSFQTKGAHLVQAQLSDHRLKADNIRHLAVNVEEFIPVLLVNGETSTELDENETYYLERALKPPMEEGRRRISHVEPTTITEFGISAADFTRHRLVILANVASLAAQNAVLRLEDYVNQGGALIVFPGDRVDARFYNDQLFKNGKGLLPARLGAEVGSGTKGEGTVNIELVKPVHPGFERFTGERAPLLNRYALFWKYFELTLPEQTEDIRVVARFDGGEPAIVEKTFGQGKVVLFASSGDTEWNNLGKTGTLLIIMQDLLGYLAASDFEQRNVIVHQPYRRTFAPDELVETATVRPPGGAGAEKKLRPYAVRSAAPSGKQGDAAPALTEIVFIETDAAGPYELELERKGGTNPPVEYFSVNVPPEESDLRRYGPDEAKAAIKGFEFRYARSVAELKLAVRQSRTGREFTHALLLSVLAIACAELILGQRFGR